MTTDFQENGNPNLMVVTKKATAVRVEEHDRANDGKTIAERGDQAVREVE
jgi:hypothetical protein